MIRTERFTIKPLSPNDVTQNYLDWFDDSISKRYIAAASITQSIHSLKEYVIDRSDREDVLFLGIFVSESGVHIGNVKFEPINIEEKKAVVGILIGDKDWRARGVTPEVLDACFDWLYVNRSIDTVILGVDKFNTEAIRAYHKAGFVIEPPEESAGEQKSAHRMARRRLRNADRLALGTVQFGLKYGIANHSGQVTLAEIAAILSFAKGAGMDSLDTAMTYGRSEENLGQSGVSRWRVITKLPPVPNFVTDVEKWAHDAVANSLIRLKIGSLEGLLLHRAKDFSGPKGEQLNKALLELKQQGLVKKIGVSIYHPYELDGLIGERQIDLVQAPFNLVDQRILTSGWMTRLHKLGVELHIRSVFLQGLLLSEKLQRDPRFRKWNTLWDAWSIWLKEERLSPLQACLGFALGHPEINRIVVGVDKKNQLAEIFETLNFGKLNPPDFLISSDLDLIQPSRWMNID